MGMTILYDVTLMKPGCVLLQAAAGCVISEFSTKFPTECWLLSPTPNMKVYECTEEQLQKLVNYHQEASVEKNEV